MNRNDNEPLRCSDVLERVLLFVGDDLESDVQESVARHLRDCSECRAEEARAREARERFRGAMDDSLRTSSKAGLWTGIRSQLVEEGLLGSGSNADESVSSAPAPVRTSRPLRILAPLAAAAAVLFAFFLTDSFGLRNEGSGPQPTVATEASDAGTPTMLVGHDPEAQPANGLRHVAPGDEPLFQNARPFQMGGSDNTPLRPHQLPGTTLVNYR